MIQLQSRMQRAATSSLTRISSMLFLATILLLNSHGHNDGPLVQPIYAADAVATPEIYLPIVANRAAFPEPFRSTPLALPTAILPTATPAPPNSTVTATAAATAEPALTPILTPTPVPTHSRFTPTPPNVLTPTSVEKEKIIAEKLNQQRAANGIAALTAQDQLVAAARRHSLDMATTGHTSHTGSDGSAGRDRITDAGYTWQGWGEILAWGYNTEYDELVADWMNSPIHRSVILDPFYVHVGAGQIFKQESPHQHYWTVNFATPLTSRARANATLHSCVITIGNDARGSTLQIHSTVPC